MPSGRIYVVLVHHPVRDRNDDEIAATVDEFDFFDTARLGLVYPVQRVIVVQPVPKQKELLDRLMSHGVSDKRPASRGRFDHVWQVDHLEDAVTMAEQDAGDTPLVIATTARSWPGAIGFSDLRGRIEQGTHVVLLIGKAWGLAERVLDRADHCLQPISGGTGFDHLPVRGAVAITLDRLLGVHT